MDYDGFCFFAEPEKKQIPYNPSKTIKIQQNPSKSRGLPGHPPDSPNPWDLEPMGSRTRDAYMELPRPQLRPHRVLARGIVWSVRS